MSSQVKPEELNQTIMPKPKTWIQKILLLNRIEKSSIIWKKYNFLVLKIKEASKFFHYYLTVFKKQKPEKI